MKNILKFIFPEMLVIVACCTIANANSFDDIQTMVNETKKLYKFPEKGEGYKDWNWSPLINKFRTIYDKLQNNKQITPEQKIQLWIQIPGCLNKDSNEEKDKLKNLFLSVVKSNTPIDNLNVLQKANDCLIGAQKLSYPEKNLLSDKLKADRKAKEEADRKAKEEADRKAKEEADRKAKEDADRKAKEEADKKAKEDADRKAKEDADRKAKEEADRKAKEEADRKAKEEADKKAKEEADRKAKEEADKKAKEEADRKAKEEADRKAKEDADRKAKEEADRKAKEEADRKAKEEADRKAKEEADRKAKEEADKKIKEEADRKAKEEADRKEIKDSAKRARLKNFKLNSNDNLKLSATNTASLSCKAAIENNSIPSPSIINLSNVNDFKSDGVNTVIEEISKNKFSSNVYLNFSNTAITSEDISKILQECKKQGKSVFLNLSYNKNIDDSFVNIIIDNISIIYSLNLENTLISNMLFEELTKKGSGNLESIKVSNTKITSDAIQKYEDATHGQVKVSYDKTPELQKN